MASEDRIPPIVVHLEHPRGVERYLGVRPFDVGIEHRDRTGGTIWVGREEWMAFVADVIAGGPYDNGVLEVVHQGDVVRHLHGGEKVPTPWCIRTVQYRESVFLSGREWEEFQRLARRGEWDVPPTPAVRPAIGAAGRAVITAALVLAVAALAGGGLASLLSGEGRGVELGASAAAALAVAAFSYRFGRSAWGGPGQRTEQAFTERGQDVVARLLFRAPELIIAGGIGGLSAAGIVAGALTGEWRWAVTGFVAGAAFPVIGLVVLGTVAVVPDGTLSHGHLLFAALLLAAGVPGVVLGALWTGNIWVLPIGLGAAIAMAGLSAFNGASAALRGD